MLSEYRDEVISDMPLLPPILELHLPPTEEELSQTLSKLRKSKAGGKSDILPELILSGGPELWDRVLTMIKQVWEDSMVVRDWQDALVVPIPKKGDLRYCDNWRGIYIYKLTGCGREDTGEDIVKERLEVLIKFSQSHRVDSRRDVAVWTGHGLCC